MEKWKIAAILLILVSLGGYGVFSQTAQNTVTATPGPVPTPTPSPLIGKAAAPWNIGSSFWMNTPAPGISLQDTKGHVTLLEFWRTGCPHCQASIPDMGLIYSEYKYKGVKMIAFESAGSLADPSNPENNWQDVQDKVKTWEILYPVAFDKDGALFKGPYKGELYPTVIILDKKGIIRFLVTGHDDKKQTAIIRTLDKLVAEK